MEKYSDELLNHSQQEVPPRAHLRYIGFDRVEGGRRLNFSVKSFGQPSTNVALNIPDSAFTGSSKISIQEAAPIAYAKLTRLLAAGERVDSGELALTETDIAQYRSRQPIEPKRPMDLMMERRRRSGLAA